MYDIHLQHHVLVHEVGQGCLVGNDASHLGGSQKDILGLLLLEEAVYSLLVYQVQFCMGAGDDVVVALSLQLADNGATHHTAVSGNVYFGILFHHITFSFG